MKAVVLEIKNGYAAVLTNDGSVIKIRRKCSVGDTIEITAGELAGPTPSYTKRLVRVAAIAAAVVLIVFGVSGGYYYTAMAATTVTIHASDGDLTLSLNRMDRVIKVEASGSLREDAVETLYSEGIRNCALPEALEKASGILGTGSSEEDINDWLIDLETENDKTYEKMKGQIEEKGFHIYSAGPAADKDSSPDPANEQLPEFPFPQNTAGQESGQPGQEFSGDQPQDTAFGQSSGQPEMTEEAQSSGQPGMTDGAQPSGQAGSPETTDSVPAGQAETVNPAQPSAQSELSDNVTDSARPGGFSGQPEMPDESSGEPGMDNPGESSGETGMTVPGESSGQPQIGDSGDSSGRMG